MSATDQPKSVVSVPREVQRVAAALAVEWYCNPGDSQEARDEATTQWAGFVSMARAALAAAPLPQGEHLYDALHGMRSWALEMIRKHADPNGTDYEQGQNDMGRRWVAAIDERLQALAHPQADRCCP